MGRYDILDHLANVLYVVAYFFRDILWLRVMVIAGCLVEIYYRLHVAASPMWADIIWCCLFIVLNSYQLAVLIHDRRAQTLSPEEKELREKVFSGIPLGDFKRLMKSGRRKSFPAETVLIEEKTRINSLYLLVRGQAAVIANGKVVSHLPGCSFAGEMSFLTEKPTSARVVTTTLTQCIIWEKAALMKLMNGSDQLRLGMQSVFNKDLINKLLKHTAPQA